MDNRQAMVRGAVDRLVGRPKEREGIYRTVASSNSAGGTGAILSIEEREELESRGINPDWDRAVFMVLEQPYIDSARNATQEEINDYLTKAGFKLVGTRRWSNEHEVWSNGVYELFDARPANVLKGKDGNLYFIDTVTHSVAYMNDESDQSVSKPADNSSTD